MERRDLLKRAACLAAWSGFRASQAGAAETDQPSAAPRSEKTGQPSPEIGSAPTEIRKGNMLYRTLGRTGERVSAFGLGGHHIGLVKEEQDSVKLVRSAIDRGITFMDNCWDYHNGKSEEWMGKALRDGYREKVFLLSLIHISEPTRLGMISYAVF